MFWAEDATQFFMTSWLDLFAQAEESDKSENAEDILVVWSRILERVRVKNVPVVVVEEIHIYIHNSIYIYIILYIYTVIYIYIHNSI